LSSPRVSHVIVKGVNALSSSGFTRHYRAFLKFRIYREHLSARRPRHPGRGPSATMTRTLPPPGGGLRLCCLGRPPGRPAALNRRPNELAMHTPNLAPPGDPIILTWLLIDINPHLTHRCCPDIILDRNYASLDSFNRYYRTPGC